MLVPQLTHAVRYRWPASHRLDRIAVKKYLESVLRDLTYHQAAKYSVEEQIAVMRIEIQSK